MSVRLVIDMNLSPDWCDLFARHGYDAVHWIAVGDPRAADETIMAWAIAANRVVFTHDLDFGTLLAATNAAGPSVLQVRARDVLPESIGPLVLAAVRQHESSLAAGVLLTVDVRRSRVRVLPLMGDRTESN